MNITDKSHGITPEELKMARMSSDIIRRTPTITGEDAAMVIDKAIAAILEEGERADKAEAMLHEISASLTNGPDIGPELHNAVKDELSALHEQIDDVATELGWPKKGDDRSLLEVVEGLGSELKSERDRADKAEAELKIHQHWHEEAIKLQGPEPGRTPSMVNAWIRNLMSRLGASELRLKVLEDRLEGSQARTAIVLKAVKDAGCNIDFDHPDGPYMEMH